MIKPSDFRKVTLPVLQLWAPSVGFIAGTAEFVNDACAHVQRQQMERSIRDRQANGAAFEGERVVRRHALVGIRRGTNEVTIVLMESEARPR